MTHYNYLHNRRIPKSPQIIEAYGMHWPLVKKNLHYNGWCKLDPALFPHIEKEFNKYKFWWWRPKSLKGFLVDPRKR